MAIHRVKLCGFCYRSKDDISNILLWDLKQSFRSRARPYRTYINQLEDDIGLSRKELPWRTVSNWGKGSRTSDWRLWKQSIQSIQTANYECTLTVYKTWVLLLTMSWSWCQRLYSCWSTQLHQNLQWRRSDNLSQLHHDMPADLAEKEIEKMWYLVNNTYSFYYCCYCLLCYCYY